MDEVLTLSATRQAALLRRGEISSSELIEAHLERIDKINPAIHAAVEVLADRARAMALRADESLVRGEVVGPLHGVPFSIKDSIEVKGTVCTGGTLGRRNAQPSERDAEVVRRLRQAGGIPIARTNLPDLLFAFESANLLFGTTNNPYDLACTPGGSSGGETALIAACGSPCGLGSDAAGSVRLPAAFCGIAGIKPTSGRLPRTGHFPPAGGWIEALWQIGPMSRRVEDLVTMMRLLAGGDGADPTVIDMPFREPGEVRLWDLRVAFYTDNGIAQAGDDVDRAVRQAAKALDGAALCVEEARPPCLEQTYDLEMKLIGPDGGDSLRQYLAGLGSHECHPLLIAWLEKLEPYRTTLEGFAAYWSEWDSYRKSLRSFLSRYDVILCPAYTGPALPHGVSTEEGNFRGFSHTMAYNLAGWPAATVRCDSSVNGLPLAVQVAASPFREDIVLAVAQHLENVFGGWQPIRPLNQ